MNDDTKLRPKHLTSSAYYHASRAVTAEQKEGKLCDLILEFTNLSISR